MSARAAEFDRIRAVLRAVDPDEPLTAREIRDLLADRGVEIDSAHRVATILGRHARSGEVEVLEGTPYRYRLPE